MSDKPRYPRADAIAVARELVRALTWHCLADRIVVAGSLRRRKAEAGDVEIVYIPRMSESQAPCDLFGRTEPRVVNIADEALGGLLECGIIEQRKNINGAASWGAQNKYARHVASGIPVDFFATSSEAWWNYLVCRTGGAANNTEIASRAKARGWHWNPYGPGFSRGLETRAMHSERDVHERAKILAAMRVEV